MIFSTVLGPHEPAFTVGSLAITATGRPAMRPEAGDDAVGAQPLALPVGQQRLLGERAVVEQPRDALAHGQLALLARLVVVALGAAAEGAVQRLLQITHCSLLISKTWAASPRDGRGRQRPARAQADGQQPAGADGQHQRPADQRRLAAGGRHRGGQQDRDADPARAGRPVDGRERAQPEAARVEESSQPVPAPGPKSGEEPKSWSSDEGQRERQRGQPARRRRRRRRAPDGGRGWRRWRRRAPATSASSSQRKRLHAVGREDQVDEAQDGEDEAHRPEQHAQRRAARGREAEAERRQRGAGPGQRAAGVQAVGAEQQRQPRERRARPARTSRPAARSRRRAARRPRAASAGPACRRRPARRPRRRSGCPSPTRRRSAPGAARRAPPAPPRRPRRRHPGAATDAA